MPLRDQQKLRGEKPPAFFCRCTTSAYEFSDDTPTRASSHYAARASRLIEVAAASETLQVLYSFEMPHTQQWAIYAAKHAPYRYRVKDI